MLDASACRYYMAWQSGAGLIILYANGSVNGAIEILDINSREILSVVGILCMLGT
jgi:hypothetical protein